MQTIELLTQLEDYCKSHREFVSQAIHLSTEDLNRKEDNDSWSALECIEHLNRYGDYYLPAITKSLNSKGTSKKEFSPGWLGDYFAKSMLPSDTMKTMKTFRSMNPAGSDLDLSVLTEFHRQIEVMLELLNKARGHDLNKIRIPISISQFIRLKLGDTFRFVIYHNERHVQQARKALQEKS